MPITSGSIEYERRLNLGEYNHKNVVAKVSWTVEPGEIEEQLAIAAATKVVMRVKDVLNWKPAVPSQVKPEPNPFDIAAERIKSQRHIEPNPGPDMSDESETGRSIANIAAPDLPSAVAEITAGIPPALKRHRRTKAEMEAARAAAIGPQDETLADLVETTAAEPGMPSFDPEPTPPAEVTGQDLQNACAARASGGLPSATIKELVAKFSPGGLHQIPKEARRRFLDELAKL